MHSGVQLRLYIRDGTRSAASTQRQKDGMRCLFRRIGVALERQAFGLKPLASSLVVPSIFRRRLCRIFACHLYLEIMAFQFGFGDEDEAGGPAGGLAHLQGQTLSRQAYGAPVKQHALEDLVGKAHLSTIFALLDILFAFGSH